MGELLGYEDFYANCNHMPGSERTLRVGGKVTVRTGGWSAKLVEHEGPSGINPFMLTLDLVVTKPQGGVPDVIKTIEIEEFSVTGPTTEYQEVSFHLVGVGEEDEPPPSMKVEHLE